MRYDLPLSRLTLTVPEALQARDTRSSYKLSSLRLCIRKYSEGRPSIAQLIPVIFPHLDHLVIHHVHPREFDSLRHLQDLTRLQSLMVGGVSLEFISPVLEVRGAQLRELSLLCYGGNSGKISLSLVWSLCPSLVSLTVSGTCVSCEQPWLSSSSPLPSLTNLQLTTHAHIPQSVWTCLLSTCLLLSSLEMTGCQGLWDESLARLLESHPSALANIRRFCVKGSHRGDISLTEASVARLRRRCGGLVELGDCFTWSLQGTGLDSLPVISVHNQSLGEYLL